MRIGDEAVIALFESRQSALEGRALVEAAGRKTWHRPRAAVVGRDQDGSRARFDVPMAAPAGAAIGAVLGAATGSVGGVEGLVVGFFFGLYIGIFADGWRTSARGDLLDEIQDVLGPGQSALVWFARPPWSASVERRLAVTGAVPLRRFPGTSIVEDVAREVREATADLERLVDPADGSLNGSADRELTVAARRKLTMLEAVADRLLWVERLEFGCEISRLNRELRESSGWRAARAGKRVATVRSSHRRRRMVLEASRNRLGAAQALIEGNAAWA